MAPFVSVIIPAYNCEAFVAEAIESALVQDHPHTEVVVVNDGSTDGTLGVLRRYGDRIRVIDQPNGGPQRARNAGLAAAQGDYIAFLDADDIWLQGKLSAQVAHLEACPDVGVCYFQWHVWPADRDGTFRRPPFSQSALHGVHVNKEKSGWIYRRLLLDCELLTTTVMLRRSIARQVGEFDLGLHNGEDYDYWLRLSQTTKIDRLEPSGALYRVVQGSVSRSARRQNDELAVIQLALSRFGRRDPGGSEIDPIRLERRMDALVLQHGFSHLRRGDPRIASSAFSESLRKKPWRPKLWARWFEAQVRSCIATWARRS